MKLTKSQLKQIIKEEILKTLNEGSRYRAKRLDNGLVRVYDYESKLTGLYNKDLSYRSGDLNDLSIEQVKAALPGAVDEALGMDQEARLSTKVLPLLLQLAGGNPDVAKKMAEALKLLVDQLLEEAQLSTEVLPLLMDAAGGNLDVAKEMVERLNVLVQKLPEEL